MSSFPNAKVNLFSLHKHLSVTAFVLHGGQSVCSPGRQDLRAGGAQGTCLDKAIDLERSRSKAVLSGRRRENSYMMTQILGRENNF